jgi:Zn-dependent peptidase ImmA (M78 family)/transcriptional regulator with XRE-family HTH domain
MPRQTTSIPINPIVLKWAREWRGRSLEDAADRVKKSVKAIEDWETVGSGATPTVKQARNLAEFYSRPFVEFFLPAPPELQIPAPLSDFRTYAGTRGPLDAWEVAQLSGWARVQRSNALDLYAELGETPPNFPTGALAAISELPEVAAARARQVMGFSVDGVLGIAQKSEDAELQLPSALRMKFEAMGVLVLRSSLLKSLGIRGVSISQLPLPVVVFRDESPGAQAFTLLHEFAHILLGESAISGTRTSKYDEIPVERWCDRFAASFLMPAEQLRGLLGAPPSQPADTFSDETLSRLSKQLQVSQHSFLVRLVQLGYVATKYYWEKKKPEFDKYEAEYQRFGRAKYYGVRYKNALGDLYTGLVLDAWNLGRITNHNAAEYMGIRNLSHLYDIRAEFRQG